MITQDQDEFKRHVKYLIKKVLDLKGFTSYSIRTEIYDFKDPYGTDKITCGQCGRDVSLTHHCTWKKSGYLKYLDTITNTPCCGKTVEKELCPFICIRCQRIALFMTPHMNKRGFEYKAGNVYHIDRCSECDGTPGMNSLILEQVVHDNINGTKP